jgi:hypothetical protein
VQRRLFHRINSMAKYEVRPDRWEAPLYVLGTSKWAPAIALQIIDIHDQSIKQYFPKFLCLIKSLPLTVWRGTVQPRFVEYELEIRYSPGCANDRFQHKRMAPQVIILNPDLKCKNNIDIPHLYQQPWGNAKPQLCLYWPLGDDWHNLKPIGETIMPWAIEWIEFYELWEVTNKWGGPEAPHSYDPNLIDSRTTFMSARMPNCGPWHRNHLYSDTALRSMCYNLSRI